MICYVIFKNVFNFSFRHHKRNTLTCDNRPLLPKPSSIGRISLLMLSVRLMKTRTNLSHDTMVVPLYVRCDVHGLQPSLCRTASRSEYETGQKEVLRYIIFMKFHPYNSLLLLDRKY